jgi:hypothetical protein
LVGHIVKGAIWVEKKAEQAEKVLGPGEKIPQSLIDVIQHIILSHHGEPEFGAARLPSTPEAIAVHVIENLDAKLMMALSLTRGEGAMAESNWTDWQKAFGGRLYRPDVAPADAAPPDAVPPEAPPPAVTQPVIAPRVIPPAETRTAPVPAATLKVNNPLFESAPARKR